MSTSKTTKKDTTTTTKCLTDGCGHDQADHLQPGNTCWGGRDEGTYTCPCLHYANSKAELEVLAAEAAGTTLASDPA